MSNETYKFLQKVFGDSQVYHYMQHIDDALRCRGKYKDSHGMLHAGIVLYINCQGDEFISKASIYATLDALIAGKDKIDTSGILLPVSPTKILKLAKQFIDNFEKVEG